MFLAYGKTDRKRFIRRIPWVLILITVSIILVPIVARLYSIRAESKLFTSKHRQMHMIQSTIRAIIADGGPGVGPGFVQSRKAVAEYVKKGGGTTAEAKLLRQALDPGGGYGWRLENAERFDDYLLWDLTSCAENNGQKWYFAMRCDGEVVFVNSIPPSGPASRSSRQDTENESEIGLKKPTDHGAN